MEETAAASIPEADVSIGDDGVIRLSAAAEEALNNVVSFEEAKPAPEEQPPPPEVIPTPPATRTIKHNGQEIQVPVEQEIALIQKGYDYESKRAQLEAERAKLQAYNGLVSAIEASPEIRQKVSQALGYQQQAQAQQQPQFDDPIEQLKYEVRQETLREVEAKFIKPIQQQTAQQAHIQTLNNVKQQVQADPFYTAVQGEILRTVQALPPSVAQDLYRKLDQDPSAYMDMYSTIKTRIAAQAAQTQTQNIQAQPTAAPQPAKRETKAPLLESGNNAPEPSSQKAQMEYIKALEKRSRAGDFRATGELMELMA